MRQLVYEWLTQDGYLTAVIPAERWIQQGAMDDPPPRPFAVVGFTDRPRTDVGSARPRLVVWIHDNRGSYFRIDDIIKYLEEELPSAVPLENDDYRIVDIRWEGSSADLTDDGYSTNTRNAEFSLTGRK
jgi:hypothetical protein